MGTAQRAWGWWSACGAGLLACTMLAACAPARPRLGPAVSQDLVVRASDVTAPGPRVRSLRTLVTTGAGDRRVDEERTYSAIDAATGQWTATTRERALGENAWSDVQTSLLSRAPDGSVWLHAITNHASGKVATLTRRDGSPTTAGVAPGLVIVPPVLRVGEVHEDVSAARTTEIGSQTTTRGGLTGSARVRTWIEADPDAPHAGIVHMQLTISAGPAIVQRRTRMRVRDADGVWTLAGEVSTLTVRVGPLIIEDITRDAEVAAPDALSAPRQ